MTPFVYGIPLRVNSKKTLTGHGRVVSIAFSTDSTLLASAGDKINLWDTTTRQHYKALGGSAEYVAFNGDGTTLASGGNYNGINLWDIPTGQHQKAITGHIGTVNCVSFSSDGATLAGGSYNGIHLWDTTTGNRRENTAYL